MHPSMEMGRSHACRHVESKQYAETAYILAEPT